MSEPIQIGDFRIERQIGAGGMGIVYLATQVSLNRKVALKVLGQSLTRQSDKQRFQREAQAVAKLNDPNIAKVHYVGQDDRLCYMAMEYIDGVSLRDCIERLARTTEPGASIDDFVALPVAEPTFERFDETEELAPTADILPDEGAKATVNPCRSPQAEESISSDRYVRRCAEIIRDVANALQHAHDQGVIHRDLKPDNLMLDKAGKIHIIDFGVAKFFEDATMTQTGALVGTPIYMSPEQVTGRIELDERSDIYSLGIVLYELLVLQHPITATTRDGVLRNIALKPLRPVSDVNVHVPKSLQNIAHKATSKDPDKRYESARDFAIDLDRHMQGLDVHASQYRFRHDESEIRAQRPAMVVLFAFADFMIGFITAVAGFFLLVNGLSFAGVLTITFSVIFSILACLFYTGRSRASLLLNLLIGAPLAGFLLWWGHSSSGRGDEVLGWITASVLMFFAVVPYLSKSARSWFAFARKVRSGEATDV